MATVLTGDYRNAVLTINRYFDGVLNQTFTFDIRHEFTYNGTTYVGLGTTNGVDDLALLSNADYTARLTDFLLYVQQQTQVGESQLNISTLGNQNVAWGTDANSCPIGQSVGFV